MLAARFTSGLRTFSASQFGIALRRNPLESQKNTCRSLHKCPVLLTAKNDNNEPAGWSIPDCGEVITSRKAKKLKPIVISDAESDKELPLSFSERFKPMSDESQVILDITEEMEQDFSIYTERDEAEKQKNYMIDTTRGEDGVFDVEQLVDLLRVEKMKDIAVIYVPPHLRYTDFLVLANATSSRHLKAVIEIVNKVYKLKKGPKDRFLSLDDCKADDWVVLDMGNIVFHSMLHETRERYQIETLWTCGQEYDDLTQRPTVDPVIDSLEQQMKYLQTLIPNTN